MIVPFDTDHEAVALANDTEYGLSAAIITRDVGRGVAIGDRLHSASSISTTRPSTTMW